MQRLHLGGGENNLRGPLSLRKATGDDEAMRGVPMFRSVEEALRFSFHWRATDGVKASQIREFVGKEGGMILSASEKKAQAGSILAVIASHLSRDQQAVLDAQYGGEQGERHAAIERLSSINTHGNRTLVRMLMMREFVAGERYCPRQAEIARECGVHPSSACRVAQKIAQEIGELRESTIKKLRPAFERRGWIQREEA